jgi:hypothetical protein
MRNKIKQAEREENAKQKDGHKKMRAGKGGKKKGTVVPALN